MSWLTVLPKTASSREHLREVDLGDLDSSFTELNFTELCIEVNCISNILTSVLLCRTLKPKWKILW